MRRTQIQLEESLHAALRRIAYEKGTSMASVIRETLHEALGTPKRTGGSSRRGLERFPFVGAGRSRRNARRPVSESHDEALAEALAPKTR